MRIFVTIPNDDCRDTFLTKKSTQALLDLGDVSFNPYPRGLTPEELIELAADAEVLVTGWGTGYISKDTVEQIPTVKLIAHVGAAVIFCTDPQVCDLGIKIVTGNDIFAKSVAEGTLCYTLCALRRLEHYCNLVREGGWHGEEFRNRGLIGKKVGIVSVGAIARHFMELLRWFDCELLIYSGHMTDEEAAAYGGRRATLEEVFSECDVISVHASSTPKTIGMVTRELMSLMKPDALLVNTARGIVIDEEAMFEMLLDGKFYAALDVYVTEPLPADHPIRKCKNALLIPHMGGPTLDHREVVALEVFKDIKRYQNGEPLVLGIEQDAVKRMTQL